jgi:hypothetical protein
MKLAADGPLRRDFRDGFGYSTSNVPQKKKAECTTDGAGKDHCSVIAIKRRA